MKESTGTSTLLRRAIQANAVFWGGNRLVAVVADVGLLFAILQMLGLRRTRLARPA